MNLAIMNTRISILNKIRFKEASSSLECSNIPKLCFLLLNNPRKQVKFRNNPLLLRNRRHRDDCRKQ